MTLENINPGAAATASGVKALSEAAKLPEQYSPQCDRAASRLFVWDRRSNSVEPLCDLSAAVSA